MRLHREEAGQAIVIAGLALVGVLVASGLAIDAALLFVERRSGQVAADGAAFAAAVTMAKKWDAANRATLARTSALDYANRNGYNNDGTTNTVTVNIPPTGGAYSGNADYAEVKIRVSVRMAFIRILGSSFQAQPVEARAVGGITGPATPYAIIALSKTASPAFKVTGQGEVETEGAGILVNSSAPTALSCSGNQHEIEVEDGGLDVVGGASGCDVDGTLRTGVAQQPDPLAYLVPPDLTVPPNPPAISVTSGTVTLDPGVYLSISVSGNGKVKLRSGTYVIKGGGISATGNGRIEDESHGDNKGVFIYNACSNYPLSGGVCGGISVSGNGRIELEKETSGTYKGLSIWQPCENTQPLTVTGGGADQSGSAGSDDGDDDEDAELETSGTIYVPCAAVDVSGHGELEIEDGQLVADTVSVTGNAEIEVEWDSAASSIQRIPALVE